MRWCQTNICEFSQAFKRAKAVADAELAQRKGPLKMASSDEIRRVLNAKTDLDCLQACQQFCFVMVVHAWMLSICCCLCKHWYAKGCNNTNRALRVRLQQISVSANHVLLPSPVLCAGIARAKLHFMGKPVLVLHTALEAS